MRVGAGLAAQGLHAGAAAPLVPPATCANAECKVTPVANRTSQQPGRLRRRAGGGQGDAAAAGAAALEAIARDMEPLWAMLSEAIGRIEAGLASIAPHADAAAATRVLPPGAAQARARPAPGRKERAFCADCKAPLCLPPPSVMHGGLDAAHAAPRSAAEPRGRAEPQGPRARRRCLELGPPAGLRARRADARGAVRQVLP